MGLALQPFRNRRLQGGDFQRVGRKSILRIFCFFGPQRELVGAAPTRKPESRCRYAPWMSALCSHLPRIVYTNYFSALQNFGGFLLFDVCTKQAP